MNVDATEMAVFVSDHAYWRCAERYPRFDTIKIEDDIRHAFEAGRVKLSGTGYLLAWSRDKARCWVLAAADNGYVVVTACPVTS